MRVLFFVRVVGISRSSISVMMMMMMMLMRVATGSTFSAAVGGNSMAMRNSLEALRVEVGRKVQLLATEEE